MSEVVHGIYIGYIWCIVWQYVRAKSEMPYVALLPHHRATLYVWWHPLGASPVAPGPPNIFSCIQAALDIQLV